MVDRYAHFSASISNVNQYVQKIESQRMQSYGLSGSCAQYLIAVLTSEGGLDMTSLGERCRKDKAAVSRTVSQLEEKELVVRKNHGDGKYRSKILLTEKGKKAAIEVGSAACRAVELAGKGLSDEQRENFYRALDIISENLKGLLESGVKF